MTVQTEAEEGETVCGEASGAGAHARSAGAALFVGQDCLSGSGRGCSPCRLPV